MAGGPKLAGEQYQNTGAGDNNDNNLLAGNQYEDSRFIGKGDVSGQLAPPPEEDKFHAAESPPPPAKVPLPRARPKQESPGRMYFKAPPKQ